MSYVFGSSAVAVYQDKGLSYPSIAPYHPSHQYPEYAWSELSTEPNNVYDACRNLLKNLGLDRECFGTPAWNPMKEIISGGEVVLIKPAMTVDKNISGDSIFAIIPHGSVIRAILDYVLLARPYKIIIADGPIPNARFKDVCRLQGLDEVVNYFQRIQSQTVVELLDIRDEYAPKDSRGKVINIFKLPGDPLGYELIDLGSDSMLEPISEDWMAFRSVSSVRPERFAPPTYHRKGLHLYSIPRSILMTDTVINVAKMKTHRKVGISCVVKNVVGITNKKFWLPHWREGIDGSDYNDAFLGRIRYWTDFLRQKMYVLTGRRHLAVGLPVEDGNWPGNDTAWRMVLDLYRILLYADKQGRLQESQQRKHFGIVDGIVGGEHFGPLAPRAIRAGILVAGISPVSVDAVSAWLMGFDACRIKLLTEASASTSYIIPGEYRVEKISLLGVQNIEVNPFAPPLTWRSYLRM